MLEMDIKKKKKALTVAIILFVITSFLAIMMVIEFTNIKQFELTKDNALNQVIEAEWNYIYSNIQANYSGAKEQSKNIKSNIIQDVDNSKLTNTTLKEKLDAAIKGTDTTIISLIGENIEGVYYKGIKNDANDPFVITRDKILSDLSLNCSAENRTRSFEEEVGMHFNKILAEQALHSIVMQESKEVFWNFVEVNKEYPWYDDIKNMKTMDIENLKALFLKHKDIKALETFEFISTSYIYEKKDIVGEAIIDFNGVINKDANQLFVNSVFNITDVIKSSAVESVVIAGYEKDIQEIEKDFVAKRNYNYALMIIEGLAYFVTLIALASLQSFILNKK